MSYATKQMSSNNDKVWVNDIGVLLQSDKLMDIWPNDANTLDENYNAMLRFLILYSVVLAMFKQTTIPFAMLFIFMISFYLYYQLTNLKIHNDQQTPLLSVDNDITYPEMQIVPNPNVHHYEAHDDIHCKTSTQSNPFRNPMIGESTENLYRPLCNENNEELNHMLTYNLPRSEWDLYNNQNSQRQFYTVTNHTSYVDQTEYAKWLYSDSTNRI